MEIIKQEIVKLESFRNEYFKSLSLYQELYLELMVPNSDIFLLIDNNNEAGYVIVTTEGKLIEFFLRDQYIPNCVGFFNMVIRELSVKSILCKSFDYLLLNCCLLNNYSYSVIGVLYRYFHDNGSKSNPEIKANLADELSVNLIMQHNDCMDEIFDNEDYLRHFINNDNVYLFFKDSVFIGCGTLIQTHADWQFCDLGVWVNSNYRKQGIGTHIISFLRLQAITKNLIPSCGCAIDNIASQKTIERSGFISKHKLIEFKLKE